MFYVGNPILAINVDDSEDKLHKKYELLDRKNSALLVDDMEKVLPEVWKIQ